MQKRTESGHLARTCDVVRFHAAQVRWLLSPAATAVAAFVIAFAVAMSHYAERGGIGQSWQSSYAPAVFLACTGTFGMPRPPPDGELFPDWYRALDDFLQQRSPEFDCSTVPEGLEIHWFAPPGGHASSLISLQAGQSGHLFLTGLWWKLVGVSWWKVAYIGAFYAGTAFAALALILSRFVWPPLTLPATFLPFFFDFQAFHLIERLRDFGKVPAIYVAILLLLMATTARTRRGVPLCLLALGSVLGIGVLLRSEMIVYALGLLMIAALVVIARRGEVSLRASVLALVACASTVLAVQIASRVAYPEIPGYMSHALILGMQNQRLWETHIDVHGLSSMPIFSDQSVYRNAQLLHAADGVDPVSYQTDEYGGYTNIAFRRMAADAPYFALLRIAGAAYDFFAGPWGLSPNTALAQWMRVAMCISALISLFALWRRNAAMGFAVVSIIAMGAVITSLDYEWRHFRHMRWLIFPLAIAGPFIVAHKIFAIIGPRAAERAFAWLNRVPVGAASPVLLRLTVMGLGVYLAALGAAALIQSQRTNALRAELMSLPTDSLKSQLTSLPSGAKLVAFPDQQAPFLARLDFDLAGCGKHRMNFIYRYRGKVDPTLGKKAIVRMVRSDEEAEHYFFTVHDDIFTAFDGIEMNVGDAKCLVGAYRAGPLAEPFLYHMLIDGRWRPLGSFRF